MDILHNRNKHTKKYPHIYGQRNTFGGKDINYESKSFLMNLGRARICR